MLSVFPRMNEHNKKQHLDALTARPCAGRYAYLISRDEMDFTITTKEELENAIGVADEFVTAKIMNYMDEPAQKFIQESPLVFISTADENGRLDISPKGDRAGFVKIENKNCLVIPDRPGNRMALGFHNLLINPNIGLIFIIPNMRETLRVKGTASISNDPDLLNEFSVNGKPALLCTIIEVQECMIHCGKAMIRSKLWNPETWKRHQKSLLTKQFSRIMGLNEKEENEINSAIEKTYDETLY